MPGDGERAIPVATYWNARTIPGGLSSTDMETGIDNCSRRKNGTKRKRNPGRTQSDQTQGNRPRQRVLRGRGRSAVGRAEVGALCPGARRTRSRTRARDEHTPSGTRRDRGRREPQGALEERVGANLFGEQVQFWQRSALSAG